MVDNGQQYRAFGGEPVEGLLTVAEAFRGDTGLYRGEGEPVPDGVEQSVGDVCAVQVVVEDAVGCGVALAVGVGGVREVDGVGTQQVMKDVPAGGVFDDQVGPVQFGQQRPGLRQRECGHAGRGGCGEVRAGVQADEP